MLGYSSSGPLPPISGLLVVGKIMSFQDPNQLGSEVPEIKDLDESVPFRAWQRELQALWYAVNEARILRELRFLHIVGLLMCIACLILDAQAGVFELGVQLRLGLVVPSYALGIWLLSSALPAVRTLAAIFPVAAFAGAASYIGLEAAAGFADRYLMAAATLITVCILLFPLRLTASFWLAVCGFGAVASPLVLSAGLSSDNLGLLLFVFLCSSLPILIKRRSDRLKDANFILTLKSRKAQQDLLASNKELETLSQHDSLTGLLNRRGFEQKFAAAFKAAHLSGEPLAVLLMDLDHFKAFNDTYGHPMGDDCLAQVGNLIRQEVGRQDGIAGRYGGEEFIAALSGSADVVQTAERLRKKVSDLRLVSETGIRASVTASFGARVARAANIDLLSFVRDADEALYAAKDAGRNCVVLFDPSSGKSRDVDPRETPGPIRYAARVSVG